MKHETTSAHSEEICGGCSLPENFLDMVPPLEALSIPAFREPVRMRNHPLITEAHTHRVGLVPRSLRLAEDVLVETAVLAGGEQSVRVPRPGHVRGGIPVGREGGEGYVGTVNVPHVHGEINDEGRACEIVGAVRPPLDTAHRADGVDSVLEAVRLIQRASGCVPDSDGLVSSCGTEPVPLLRVPVAAEHEGGVGRPLTGPSVCSSNVP